MIRIGADTSFGLYLFHYPLMYLTKAVLNTAGLRDGTLFTATIYVAPFLVATLLAAQCEKRKDLVYRPLAWLTSQLDQHFHHRRVPQESARAGAGTIGS